MKKELEARTKRFALSVIQFVGKLPRSKASDVIGYQLLKSGTSIGANYREANRAQSHDDFVHKVAICEKEAAETEYWLELAVEANLTRLGSIEELLQEVRELLAIFVASGRTAKARREPFRNPQFRSPNFAIRNPQSEIRNSNNIREGLLGLAEIPDAEEEKQGDNGHGCSKTRDINF
jgi:four helix bundle protein